MKELELRNLENTFYKQDKNRKYSVYLDSINSNLIVFSPYDDCDIDSICCGINNQAYSHLIKTLNNNRNLVVSWSQVSGTTSDYTIYYNQNVSELKTKAYKEILNLIYTGVNYNNCCGMKYQQVQNNVASAIKFNIDSCIFQEVKIGDKVQTQDGNIVIVTNENVHISEYLN